MLSERASDSDGDSDGNSVCAIAVAIAAESMTTVSLPERIHDTALGRYHDSTRIHDTAQSQSQSRSQYWYHINDHMLALRL